MWNELSEQVENKNSEDNEGQSFDKRACLSSTQMPSDNVNKPEVIRIVRDELQKINKANDSNNGSFINVSRELTETLKSELSGKGSVLKRDYKLTKQTKFEYFFDFFTSELIANDILYVIDETVKANDNLSESAKEKHKFKVRDILINHIDNEYHAKVMDIKDPVMLLNKIKEIKLSEVNTTSSTLRRQLYNMNYKPEKERAVDFIDKFEEIVRNYNNLSGIQTLSADEIRDAFYNAVVRIK